MCIYRAFRLSQREFPLILSFLVFLVFPILVSDAQPSGEKELAGEKFKNVTVLTSMPADQMGKVMNIISASLGVNCNYCHEGTNFAKENVGHKETARKMLSMTLSLNQSAFGGKAEVTCNTCHRGQSRPLDAIQLDAVRKSVVPSKLERKLTADEILSKFYVTLGGKDKLDAIKTRHVTAERVEPTGKREPEELWQTATGLSRMTTQYGKLVVVEGFDGQNAWKDANGNAIELKSDEAEQIRMEAVIAFGLGVPINYTSLAFTTTNRIDDREVYQVSASNGSQLTNHLYFDVESGLLTRRTSSMPTILGAFTYQVDYQDYQAFGGVMQPTTIRFAVPNITWTRQVISIETNVDMDDSMFRRPSR